MRYVANVFPRFSIYLFDFPLIVCLFVFFNCIWIFRHGQKAFPHPEVSRKPHEFFPGTFRSLPVSLPLFYPSSQGEDGGLRTLTQRERPRSPALRPSFRPLVARAASEMLTRVAADCWPLADEEKPGGRGARWQQRQVTSDQADSEVLRQRQENYTKQERQLNIYYEHFQTHVKAENTTNLYCLPPASRNVTASLCCCRELRVRGPSLRSP